MSTCATSTGSSAISPSTSRSAPAKPPRSRSPMPREQATASALQGNEGVGNRGYSLLPIPYSLIFPEHLLAPLVTLLGFERQRGNGSRIEALQADRLARLLAEAVGALLDARQGGVDLGDQLALAVAGPELECAVGLGSGPVCEVRVLSGVLDQNVQRLAILTNDLFLPRNQLVAKIDPVTLVHERLVLGRAVTVRQDDA